MRRLNHRNIAGGLLGGLLLVGGPVHALSTDKQQPIYIEADNVTIDDGRGVAVYRGNVHFKQGSAQLTADEVTVSSTDRKQVDKVVATGAPATFRQRPDNKDEDMRGQATRIEYFANEERVVLENQAQLWQGQNEFTGNRIEYRAGEDVVRAHKAPDNSRRVQVIIQPRQAAPDSDAAPPLNKPAP